MNIITHHEAQQRADVKAPLLPLYITWPHCTGPCNQGRHLCSTPEACQTGHHEHDTSPEIDRRMMLCVIAALATFWAGLALLANAAGWL